MATAAQIRQIANKLRPLLIEFAGTDKWESIFKAISNLDKMAHEKTINSKPTTKEQFLKAIILKRGN